MGFADLHIHTIHSVDGTSTPAAVLKYAAHHTDLDVIAITDHDDIRGALEALELASKYAVEVIPGIEITSRDGHVLALWVEHNIPAGLSLQETLYQIGEQDGLAIAPHPLHRPAQGLSAESIRSALDHPDLARILVGIETYNAGLILQRTSNRKARLLAETLPIAHVANSDAHTPWMIGSGRIQFNGYTARELRSALMERTTHPVIVRDIPGAFILADWGLFYTLRRAGFAMDNPAPERALRLARTSLPAPSFWALFSNSYETA
jgi:predicted metal-dependent phosphoesterase TrpH